jgi:hypothetical protein
LLAPQVKESVAKGPAFAARMMTMASFSVTVIPMTLKRWTVPVLRRNKSVGRTQTLVTVDVYVLIIDDLYLMPTRSW